MNTISNLNILLKSMQPILQSGAYYFATLPENCDLPAQKIIASIREKEGLSVVVDELTAQQYQLTNHFRASWITLNVHSDLSAIGLTARFATALSNAQISCNVVAGHHHDHIFVPYEQAQKAMNVLLDLQNTTPNSIFRQPETIDFDFLKNITHFPKEITNYAIRAKELYEIDTIDSAINLRKMCETMLYYMVQNSNLKLDNSCYYHNIDYVTHLYKQNKITEKTKNALRNIVILGNVAVYNQTQNNNPITKDQILKALKDAHYVVIQFAQKYIEMESSNAI